MLYMSMESTYWSWLSCYIITLHLLQAVIVLYSIAWGNDLRIACIAVCTGDVSLMDTEQPILLDAY